MISFTESEVKGFRHSNKALRWGQAFYNHFKLHKVVNVQDRHFCDQLYNAAEDTAKAMVASRTQKGM